MPKIPELQDRGRIGGINVNSGNIGSPSTRAAKVTQEIGNKIAAFSLNLEEKRFKAENQSFTHNKSTRDRTEIRNFIEEQKLKSPRNGEGFSASVQEFMNNKIQETSSTAPSSEALQAYQQRMLAFSEQATAQTDQFERVSRANDSRVTKIENAQFMANSLLDKPDSGFASEAISSMQADIEDEVGTNFSDFEADIEIDRNRKTIRSSYFEGLILNKNYGEALGVLRGGVSRKQFESMAEETGVDIDQIPITTDSDSGIILEGMEPKEKLHTIRQAMAGLNRRDTEKFNGTTKRVKDTMSTMMRGKKVPQEQFNRLFNDVDAIPDKRLDETEKLEMKLNLMNARTFGNTINDVALEHRSKRTPGRIDSALDASVSANKDLLKKQLQDASKLSSLNGRDKKAISAALENMDDLSFNSRAVEAMKNQTKKSSENLEKELNADASAYWVKHDTEAAGLMSKALTREPEAVEEMTSKADAFYDRMGLIKSNRKYITNEMARQWGSEISAEEITGQSAQKVFQEIHSIFGPDKTRSVIDQMADDKYITDDMATAAIYESTEAQSAAINLIKQEKELRGKDSFKIKKFVSDYDVQLQESVSDVTRALALSNRTGSNIRAGNGIRSHIDLYVRSKQPENDADAEKAFKEAQNLFLSEHLTPQGGNSLVYMSASENVPRPVVDDFLDVTADKEGINALAKAMGRTIPAGINTQGLGLSPEEIDETWENTLETRSRWVNAKGNSIRLMVVAKNGQQQEVKGGDGKPIIIQYSEIEELSPKMIQNLSPASRPGGVHSSIRGRARAKIIKAKQRIAEDFPDIEIKLIPEGEPGPFDLVEGRARSKVQKGVKKLTDKLPPLSASARAARKKRGS